MKTIGTHTETNSIGVKRDVKDKVVARNVTINPFGDTYRKTRKRKNKIRKASRKASR